MNASRRLAGLIGPVLLVMSATEALNFEIWADNDPRITYLNGLLLFIAGLAIARAHNVWRPAWPVLVTLAGWIGMIAGVYRMAFPAATQASGVGAYVVMSLLFAIGVVLTFQGWRSGAPKG